jgi:hypothetical protein
MATTSRAGLAAAGVIGVSMPMRSRVSPRTSALGTPAAGEEKAVETRSSGRSALWACAAVEPRDRTGDKECET